MRRNFFLTAFLFFCGPLSAQEFINQDLKSKMVTQISAHLAIHDAASAKNEAFYALSLFPNDGELSEIYIKALSASNDEKTLIEFTTKYLAHFPEKMQSREILEHLSWGVIEHAASSCAPIIRLYALLAAFFSNDAKGVLLLEKALCDDNSSLRGIAAKLSSELHDLKLQQGLIRLLKEDPNHLVRKEAIVALGEMKSKLAKKDLEKMIANEENEAEERAFSIKSLVNVMDKAKREEIDALSKAKRVEFRLLACELVLQQELKEELDLIMPLLKDSQRAVRRAVLEIIETLQISEFASEKITAFITPLLQDNDPIVAIYASFILMLNDHESGQKALKPYLTAVSREERLFAAAALAKSGHHGFPLISDAFNETKDPFVKMTLSFGLIGQRKMTEEACDALYLGLKQQKEPLMFVQKGGFKYLAPSDACAKEFVPNQKEALNQLVRLEILNVLCMMKDARAAVSIREFLQERSWGISSVASLVLLTEGDESSIELVELLLKDPSEKIRVQAALILSLWNAGDESALGILKEAYFKADREMKERILEGVGRIGSFSSVSFLLECLHEPFQSLRVIAASSLLQILYH